MMLPSSRWASLGVLLVGAVGSLAHENGGYQTYVTTEATVTDTTTTTTTLPITHVLDVTVSHYVTLTSTATVCITYTESTTTTLHYTASTTATLHYTASTTETLHYTASTTDTLHYTASTTETKSTSITNTETDSATVTNTLTNLATITNTKTDLATVTNTLTNSVTITNTETDSTTITNTATTTTTQTVPATITSYSTTTVLKLSYDPCPTTCKVSAGTVNLYFWPNRYLPAGVPSTYVDPKLGYTFTWPSVYMYIPTIVATNTAGQTVGPQTSNWMLPLDLADVSTIRSGSITTQLTLSDLGTDCPKSEDAAVIQTLVDSACDPILAAPRQVSTWASPCNACGRFGLFDPPYAVPTLTGGLVPTTATAEPVTVTVTPTPASTFSASSPPPPPPPESSSSELPTLETSSAAVPSSTSLPVISVPDTSTTAQATTSAPSSLSSLSSSSAAPTTVATAAAPSVKSGLAWLVSSILAAIYLM